MIVSESRLRLSLGLTSTITDLERAIISLVHPEAEQLVAAHIGYDPVQRVAIEYYPKNDRRPGNAGSEAGVWSPDGARRHAVYNELSPLGRTLQLARLPVRSIVEIRRDSGGRFGQGAGAFPGSSVLEAGSDYWLELDEDGRSSSGCVVSAGGWQAEPGSLRVEYRAGYSPTEFAGRAVSSEVDGDGVITTAGVNASPIARAVMLTVGKAFHTEVSLRKRAGLLGPVAGALTSEKLGDYAYTIDGVSAARIAGMMVALPGEAVDLLEEFVHYGLARV